MEKQELTDNIQRLTDLMLRKCPKRKTFDWNMEYDLISANLPINSDEEKRYKHLVLALKDDVWNFMNEEDYIDTQVNGRYMCSLSEKGIAAKNKGGHIAYTEYISKKDKAFFEVYDMPKNQQEQQLNLRNLQRML